MADYKRASQKFVCAGMDLNHPVDLLPNGKYPYMKNVRSYRDGIVEGRQGLTAINAVAPTDKDIHSYARVNDYVVGNFARFLGIGTNLYYGVNSFTQIDTGYSGVPISIIPYRPNQAPRPWAYIGDFNKMQKANTSGVTRNMGIAPPTQFPVTELSDPAYGTSTVFDSTSGWTNHGTAGAVSVAQRLTGVTIGTILYDPGKTTGWATVWPVGGNNSDILAGMEVRVNFGGGNYENAIVEEVHKIATLAGNTIAAIEYDSGSSGMCTVQPVSPLSGIARNAMIGFGGTEYVRIISVTNGPGGLSSFRCFTGLTHAAGEAINTPADGSFYIHFANTHVAGEALTAPYLTASIAVGTGTMAYNGGLPGLNLASLGSPSRPLGPDDYIHIAMRVDHPELLTEAKLILDVDPATTGTYQATDGNRNAYIRSVRPNDLQGVLKEIITMVQARADSLTTQQQDKSALDLATSQNPGAVYGSGQASTPYDQTPEIKSDALINTEAGYAAQLTSGELQWVDFRWKIADLTRIGADPNVDLSAVRAVQVRFTTTGTVQADIAHLWVGGTFGPDTNVDLTPYLYRYRYRASETGAKSLPGPATRSGIIAFRQAVLITPDASTDPQVDKIDIERFGGPTDPDEEIHWHYVGTVANDGSTFLDDQFNAAVVLNDGLDTDTHQPFTISDEPRLSTVNVIGTVVKWVSGDKFNTQWARGTEVIINGKVTSLSAVPTSGSKLYITDSLGAQTSVEMEIREPILTGQPLPYMWGPYYETMFACGNILDVGSVYYTNPTDPDSAPDTNRLEVVSPSETMMNGCMYDGKAFAFSNKRMFAILPRFVTSAGVKSGGFQFIEIPNGKGLFDPWSFAVGPEIYFLSSDGIYATNGGIPVCISNDIRPIFPAGDKPGVSVNGMNAIKLQNPGFSLQGPFLRLCYHNGYLFFDYLDCNDNPQTLVYDVERKAWYHDTYFEGTTEKLRFHYSEVGIEDNDDVYRLIACTSAGFVYENVSCKDGTVDIQGIIRTPALDVGDSRANKTFGDIVFDMNTNGIDVTCTVYLNNYTVNFASKTYNTTQRGITPPIDLLLGSGQLARNIGIELSWTVSTI